VTGRGTSLSGTPVLMYHSIVRPGQAGDRFAVAADDFRRHLARLLEVGRPPVKLRAFWAGEETRPSVVLTFDDGEASDFEVAFPLLAEAAFSATFFVNPSTIGRSGYLTWEQVREMHQAGQAFESHSHDHVDLSLLPARPLQEQLRRSKQELEARLGVPVDFLAVPYGLVSRRVVEVARAEGYQAVCTSRSWTGRPGAPTIPRVAIRAGTDVLEFTDLALGRAWPYLRRRARSAITYIPQQVLLRIDPARLGVRRLEVEGTL
jgi:peptidoglycan/xylan/chitin deacetylase (PgdA/CDA1 family)